jgi:hypothetical protein
MNYARGIVEASAPLVVGQFDCHIFAVSDIDHEQSSETAGVELATRLPNAVTAPRSEARYEAFSKLSGVRRQGSFA